MATKRNGSRNRQPKYQNDPRWQPGDDDTPPQTAMGAALQRIQGKSNVVPIHDASKVSLPEISCANPTCDKKRIMKGLPWGRITLIDGTEGGVCGTKCNEAYIIYKSNWMNRQFDEQKKKKKT